MKNMYYRVLMLLCLTMASVGQMWALTEMTNTDIQNVLDKDYVMVYLGVGSDWGSNSTTAALNDGNSTTAKVYATTSRGSSSAEPYYYWKEITTAIPKGSSGTYYLTNNKGGWAGQSITAALKAGGAYWMNGDWSGYTTKYSSNIFHTTSPSASIPSTAKSVTQGSTISVTTTLTKGYKALPYSAVYSKMNLKFWAKDSSGKFWEVGTNTSLSTSTSVSTTLSGVADLSAGTYTIYAALYDTYGVYIKAANTFTLTVNAPSVPTITFSSTSGTILFGNSATLSVTTANIDAGTTVEFYTTTSATSTTAGTLIGSTTVSSNAASITYKPTTYAATTYILAKTSSVTTSANYTLTITTPSVTLSASSTSVGTGDNVTFTATAKNLGTDATITSYNFKTFSSGSAVQATTSNTYTTSWDTSGTKTIYVTITVKVGSGTAYTTTASVSKSVTVQQKTTIYFQNILGWSNVYLYVYTSNYWSSEKGTGGKNKAGGAYTMTKVSGTTDIYSYTYLGTTPSYVCFINTSGMDDYEYFWNSTAGVVKAAYLSFSSSTPLYIPSTTYTALNDGGKVYYYNGGEWSVYPPASYTLTVKSANTTQGTITTPASGSYTDVSKGTAKSIVASAKDGYAFKNWTVSDTKTTVASATSASTTATVNSDATVTANFETAYTLTVTAQTGGTINAPAGGKATVGNSATMTITATKNDGYTFAGWEITSGSATITNKTSLSTTVKSVSANTTITAKFTQDEYTVTVVADGGTISTPASGKYTGVHYGDKVNIVGLASKGYPFSGWSASPAANATITASGNISTTATIKGNVTLTASFSLPPTIYVSNEDCADNVYLYFWDVSGASVSAGDFPGVKMSQNDAGWFYYTFPTGTKSANIILSNGSQQTGDIKGVDLTSNKYYKYSGTTATATTSSYTPKSCKPDVYTVVADATLVGSDWDTDDATNELTWNSTQNRYEIRKVGVNIPVGTFYYKFVKNHCYDGDGCGKWPNGDNANYYFNTAKKYDLVFWVKPNGDQAHSGLDGSYGLEVYGAATYYLNHPWGSGNWTKKEMTYTGTGSLYTVSGILGAQGGGLCGADVYDGNSKLNYYNPNSTDISGWSSSLSEGDNVIFTYDATNKTLSISCPTCVETYWINVPAGCTGGQENIFYKMSYNAETGLYYTDPSVQVFMWVSNGANVNTNKEYNNNWIQRNDIVNWSSMTNCQEVQFFYDATINQLTVVDANTPQITLTAETAVNATYDEATITLTTTASKTITNPTYSYSLVSGPTGGTFAANPTATTTFTTKNEGTYEFQVTVKCDEGTFTGTCTVKVKFKIRVLAYVSNVSWTTPYISYWVGSGTKTNQAMTRIGTSGWWEYTVKGIAEFSFLVKQGASGTDSNATVNVGPIDDDICIIVLTALQGSNRNYETTTNCELYMRFSSTYEQYKGKIDLGETATVYSNYFKQDGDQVSFYVGTTVKYQTFSSASNKWNDGTTVSGLTSGDVYAGYYDASATSKLKDFAKYTGDYYIRTDVGAGGWTNYKRTDQTMYEFSENSFYPNEWYNHYWCKWVEGNPNVKALVANDINPAISDTTTDCVLTQGTNMRFEYDNKTNYNGRQFLKGAGGDFLKIYCDNDGYIYKEDGTTLAVKSEAITFGDVTDWVYQIDVKVKPNGKDVYCYILGKYPVTRDGVITASDQDNYLNGYLDAENTTPAPIKIMGSTATTGIVYNMRLVYDYKTNRLLAAWYPNDESFSNAEITVDGNLMILRENDDDTKALKLSVSTAKVLKISRMVSALNITKGDYGPKRKSGTYFYWVSLPYNCYIKDIYGLPNYGKKWSVQRYRGDKRAELGFRNDISTFWANMKQNETAMMEANRGYVIRVQLLDGDFKQDGGLTLYFPSANDADHPITLQNSGTTNLKTTAPEYICNVIEPVTGDSRRNWDSNWNVVGQPGLGAMGITTPTGVTDPTAQEEPESEKQKPLFFYKWKYDDGPSKSTNYQPTSVSGFSFQVMYSYMMQYAGTLEWKPQIQTNDPTVSKIVRREAVKTEDDILITLNLNKPSADFDEQTMTAENMTYDRTLIQLSSNGSEEFVLNTDLAKASNDGPMLYAVCDGINTAGKVLPLDATEVALTVSVPKIDEYLVENGLGEQPEKFEITLAEPIEGRTLTLVDRLEETETILNGGSYNVLLAPGTYKNRFVLRISQKTDIVTDLQHIGSDITIRTDGSKVYFSGITAPTDINVYDVVGRQWMNRTLQGDDCLQLPKQGVWMLQVGDQTVKVISK